MKYDLFFQKLWSRLIPSQNVLGKFSAGLRTHSVFSRISGRDAGTQCHPRLRRARSTIRAYGGHAVPSAPTAGTQCHPRLRRARSAIRAYGGHAVPSVPTAFPTQANCYSSCFPLHRGSSTEASESLCKSKREKIHPFHTTSGKPRQNTQEGPTLGNSRGWALLVYGEDAFPFILLFPIC